MNAPLGPALQQLIARQDLSSDTVQKCVGAMMDGACEGVEMAAWLTAMACKGPAAIEVVGAAQAMRSGGQNRHTAATAAGHVRNRRRPAAHV